MEGLDPGVGFLLIFAGIMMVVIGILVLALSSTGEGNVEGGAVVVIGPIPIVWGSNKTIAAGLLLLAAAVFAFMLILYIYASRMIQ